MLYRTLKRMIERGQIEGMEEKLDIFLASSKITAEEYSVSSSMTISSTPIPSGDSRPSRR